MLDERDYKLMNTKSYKNQIKIDNEMAQLKVKCECSHTMVMLNVDRMICTHCKKWVYKDDKTRFKYQLKNMLKRK